VILAGELKDGDKVVTGQHTASGNSP